MAAKKITKQFKIMAPGGKATPAPPIGPVLGANGVNPGQFITKFNDATRALNGRIVGCIITVYSDRSFDFEVKSSPTSVLIAAACKVEKGSARPNTDKIGTLTSAQVKAIAIEKFKDLNTTNIDAAMRIVAGTARSMGAKVEG